jgi:hypothetical protein
MKRILQLYFPKTSRVLLIGCIAIFVLLIIATASFVYWKVVSDPNIPFLYSAHGAQWIRVRIPSELVVRNHQAVFTGFRVRFDVMQKIPENAFLNVKAMKHAAVWIDDKVLFGSDVSSTDNWKEKLTIYLTPYLSPGPHELRIYVLNESGHPALIAWCRELGLYTGEQWEASTDNKTWIKAQSVDEIALPSVSFSFQRADRAFVSAIPVFLPVFLFIFLCTLFFTRQHPSRQFGHTVLTARGTRWVLLVLGVGMGLNNIGKIPLYVGMDVFEHMEYVVYVAENMRLPLATEGWQMFEPPLFYMLSAGIYKLFLHYFSEETVWRILRILPVMCGIAQIELCYRALRHMYPEREDLQILGTVMGGFLPMTLYVSQVVGTEPLAAFLSGVVVVMMLRLHRFLQLPSRGFFVLMGVILGLSVLAKITSVLLFPAVIFSIAYTVHAKCRHQEKSTGVMLHHILLVLGISVLVSGWYFVRNWIEMGQIFVTSSQSELWWQDPGYRTVTQFISFGQSLFYPVCSGVVGVWDSLYSTMWLDGFLSGKVVYSHRPPWNYNFMLSSVWLSLLPTLAMLCGMVMIVKKPLESLRQGTVLAVFCVLVYISAILYLFFTIPFWSVAKAKYTMGIIPCYAVLCAEGFNVLTKNRIMRATVYGAIACWWVAVYAAYFVR